MRGSGLYVPVDEGCFALAGDVTIPTLLGYTIPFAEQRVVPANRDLNYEDVLKWEIFFLRIGLLLTPLLLSFFLTELYQVASYPS